MEILSISILFASSLIQNWFCITWCLLIQFIHVCFKCVAGITQTHTHPYMCETRASKHQRFSPFILHYSAHPLIHRCFSLKLQNALKPCSGDHESTSSSCLSLPHDQRINTTQLTCQCQQNYQFNMAYTVTHEALKCTCDNIYNIYPPTPLSQGERAKEAVLWIFRSHAVRPALALLHLSVGWSCHTAIFLSRFRGCL